MDVLRAGRPAARGLGDDVEREGTPSIFSGVAHPLPPPVSRPRHAELSRSSRLARRGQRSWTHRLGGQRRRWPRRLLIGTGSLVLLLVALGVALYFYGRYRFDQIHKTHVSGLVGRQGSTAPFDILLVGSDSRAFVDDASQAAQFGDTGGQRSDVIIVARVAPATRQVKLLSIPRDTWVDIPGKVPGISGPNRINAAFNSGPSLLVQTIEQTFHLPITYFTEVNFPGFSGMVNALGGVGLDFRYPVKDAYSGLDITSTGCQMVNGTQALALVRSRHLYYYSAGAWNYDGDSDFSRIQRQDAFFRAMVSKLKGALTNPIALNNFVSSATKYLTIDQTLSEGALLGLGRDFRGISSSELETETIPTSPTTIGGADVLLPAPGPDEQMLTQFLAFGTSASTPSTTSLLRPAPGDPAGGAEAAGSILLTDDRLAEGTTGGAGQAVTVTTLPGEAAPSSSSIVYNTQPEPWNPTPCDP